MEWVHHYGAVGVPFARMLVDLSFLHALEGTVAVLAYNSGRPPILLFLFQTIDAANCLAISLILSANLHCQTFTVSTKGPVQPSR